MEYSSPDDWFGVDGIVKFPYDAETHKHRTRTIAVQLKGADGQPLPEIDPKSFAIEQPGQQLIPFDASMQGGVVVVQCRVDPAFASRPDFNSKVTYPITYRVKAKSAQPVRGRIRNFYGTFKAKISPILQVRWRAWLLDDPSYVTQDTERQPMELPPDGLAGMHLSVWAEGLDGGAWTSKKGQYEFTHWLAPNNPKINFSIVKMDLPPEAIPAGDLHQETEWFSVASLLNHDQHPEFHTLPVEFYIRVRAYSKGIIAAHIRDAVPRFLPGKEEPHLAEVMIPVHLIHVYDLEIEVHMKGAQEPLAAYSEHVNGEKVSVHCPKLPDDFVGWLRWRVVGPPRVFESKKGFYKDWRQTDLNKTFPSFDSPYKDPHVSCILELNPQAKSIAEPVLDLTLDPPKMEPQLKITLSTESIKGDELDQVHVTVDLVGTRPDGAMDDISEWYVEWRVPDGTRVDVEGPSGDMTMGLKQGQTAEADFVSKWAQQDKEMVIEVEATMDPEGFDNYDSAFRKKESVTVSVIGSAPDLVLEARPDRADVDGESEVIIRPTLVMFGEPYEDPIEILELDYDFSFLEKQEDRKSQDVPTPEEANDIPFRCKFQLDNEWMKDQYAEGTKVTFKVRPLDDHYRQGVPPTGLSPDAPAVVHLQPSTIEFQGPDPSSLPTGEWSQPPDYLYGHTTRGRFDRPQPSNFVTVIRARVVSASGVPVNGTVIPGDGRGPLSENAYYEGWQFELTYSPLSAPEWRANKDNGLTRYAPSHDRGGQRLRVAEDGWIWFYNETEHQLTDHLLYDHWRTFYDGSIDYLMGQGSTIRMEFQADGVRYPPLLLPIGLIPGKSDVRVTVVAQSDEKLDNSIVTLTVGGNEKKQTTNYTGIVEFKDLDFLASSAAVTVDRKGEALLLGSGVGQDPPTEHRTVELIEGGAVDLEVEMQVSTHWALATLFSHSLSLGKVPGIGTFAGKAVPVGWLTVIAALTNLGVKDPEKMGEPFYGPEFPGYGKGNTRWVSFVGAGLAPSINATDLWDAITMNLGQWQEFAHSMRTILEGLAAAEEGRSASTVAQAIQLGLHSGYSAVCAGAESMGLGVCVPGPTAFTTDKPYRAPDFTGGGSLEQFELSGLASASWGYAQFLGVPYQSMISIGSYGISTPGISAGVWFGRWSVW